LDGGPAAVEAGSPSNLNKKARGPWAVARPALAGLLETAVSRSCRGAEGGPERGEGSLVAQLPPF